MNTSCALSSRPAALSFSDSGLKACSGSLGCPIYGTLQISYALCSLPQTEAVPRAVKQSAGGRIWANVGDGRFIVYHYSPDWKHVHPARFLKGRAGYLASAFARGHRRIERGEQAASLEATFSIIPRKGAVESSEASRQLV